MPWTLRRVMRPYVSSARSGSGGARPSSAKSERITISIQSNETLSSKSSQDLTTGSLPSSPPSPQHMSIPMPCLEDDSYLTEELSDYLSAIHTCEQLAQEIFKVQKHMASVETIVFRAIMTRAERQQLTNQLTVIFKGLLYKKEAMRSAPPPPPTLNL